MTLRTTRSAAVHRFRLLIMVSRAWLAAAALLGLLVDVSATAGCTTQVDSSSWMSGGKWVSTFQLYTQETTFKIKGDMTKVNMV
ncbi:hypothetical protein COO60DRAFT_743213 [Scenedesmus sp. NREL 46B-D3]|nr:hypothetical protein COO60DRAFT_743213 [Scenedesmus sp. NREL 46B-D3]